MRRYRKGPFIKYVRILMGKWSNCGNGILFPKLFWQCVRKICTSDQEKKMRFKLNAKNLQKFWDYKNNLFEQWKLRTIFEIEGFNNLFLEVSQVKYIRTFRIQIGKNNWGLKHAGKGRKSQWWSKAWKSGWASIVMQRATAARRHLLFCQNLKGRMPPTPCFRHPWKW